LHWQERDKKMVKRINELIKSIERDGVLCGIGKPERLKENLSGYCSRRIDEKHRLIYKVDKNLIEIVSCLSHYGEK